MALKYANQFMTVEGNTDLELSPRSGESIFVNDIAIAESNSNYITVKIDQSTVGYFRVRDSAPGNHLPFPPTDEENKTIIGLLRKTPAPGQDRMIMRSYPVAEGETFKISGAAQSNAIQVVRYDIHDAGDAEPDMPNGSAYTEIDYISYGDTGASLDDGDNELDSMNNPGEFVDFPWGIRLPENRTYILWGLLFSDYSETSGGDANRHRTKYLKFIRESTFLFDLFDLQGIPVIGEELTSDDSEFGEGQSVVGNYSESDHRLPYFFKEPLIFQPGDDLTIKLNTAVEKGSANISQKFGELGLIGTMIKG